MDRAEIKSAPDAVLIAGPTASGKSSLAVRLAELADGVIINADSMQIYAEMSILSGPSNRRRDGRR